jgi:hypothetical protein
MKRVILALLLVISSVVASGCTIAKISGAGPRPLLMNNPQGKYDVIKHFVVEKSIAWDWTNSAEMDQLVAEVLSETKADAISNLRVTIKYTFNDYMCNSVTCGYANSKTWAVEGDAIKYK